MNAQAEALIGLGIFGTLVSIAFIAVVIYMRRRYCIEGKVSGIMMHTSGSFTVYFEDGRNKTFGAMPSKPVNKGKYYKFVYDCFDLLKEVIEEAA